MKSPLGAGQPFWATCAPQRLGRGAPSHPPTHPACVISQEGVKKPSAGTRHAVTEMGAFVPLAGPGGERGHPPAPSPNRWRRWLQRALPGGVATPPRPHPKALPGQAVPPTQPQKCNRSSAFETLRATINKRGVSLAAANSLGKATAARALTQRFTQTVSGPAIRQQQNVKLLLTVTALRKSAVTMAGSLRPSAAQPTRHQGQATYCVNCSSLQRQSPYQPRSRSRSQCPKKRPHSLPPFC